GPRPVLGPLVQLLEVSEGLAVPGLDRQDLLQRGDGLVDEAGLLEIERQAEESQRALAPGQAGAPEQLAVDLDGARDVALAALQVADPDADVHRGAVAGGQPREDLERAVELVLEQVVEAERGLRGVAGGVPGPGRRAHAPAPAAEREAERRG